uniref:Uncharacterized protein n=1 Tax=Noccaea caerulescens TaxID=107243 RepID=A0A1J3ILT7_NOCCA
MEKMEKVGMEDLGLEVVGLEVVRTWLVCNACMNMACFQKESRAAFDVFSFNFRIQRMDLKHWCQVLLHLLPILGILVPLLRRVKH